LSFRRENKRNRKTFKKYYWKE